MKTAFYIEDGREQIVLTPETEWEKKMLSLLHEKGREVQILRGKFYECRGGWTRHGFLSNSTQFGESRSDDESTMLVLKEIPDPVARPDAD